MKILTFVLSLTAASQAWSFDHSHQKWNAVLSNYLDNNAFVKYKKLKADIKDSKHTFNANTKPAFAKSGNTPKQTHANVVGTAQSTS